MERESDKLTRSASRSETIQRTCLCQRVRQRPREDAGQNDARERAGHQVNGVVERPLLEVAVEEESRAHSQAKDSAPAAATTHTLKRR